MVVVVVVVVVGGGSGGGGGGGGGSGGHVTYTEGDEQRVSTACSFINTYDRRIFTLQCSSLRNLGYYSC